MKRAIIVHGWDGSPREPMHRWIKKELEKRGYKVSVPQMPNPGKPKIKPWINKIKKTVKNDENVFFIGHSVGCQAILRYLATLKNKKRFRMILIAPWMHLDMETIKEEGDEVIDVARPWMKTPINYKKVLNHLNKQTICIFSNNDPFIPLSDMKLFRKNLDAKIVILKNKGHFVEEDGIKKLPEILQFIR